MMKDIGRDTHGRVETENSSIDQERKLAKLEKYWWSDFFLFVQTAY